MCGIAEQHNPPAAPARQRLSLQDRPSVTIWARFQHVAYIAMENFVGFAPFLHVAFGRPCLPRVPLRCLRDAGHDVTLALRVRRVTHGDGTVGPPPLCARWPYIEITHQTGRKHSTIGNTTLVDRFIRPNYNLAYDRVHAVRTDHRIG